MKIADIVNQLLKVLPFNTSYFSDDNTVTLTFLAGTVTATTPTAHGLNTNDYAHISGAVFPTQIASITRVGSIATVTTSTDHDLTFVYHKTVNISGSDQAEYNGDQTLLSVDNRRKFTFTVSGSPATPATGTMLLNETRQGYNGYHQVTKISDTVFTYVITQTPGGDSSGALKSNFRVSGGVTYDRLRDSYTKQAINKMWCFVVPQPTKTGREPGMKGDAIAHLAPGSSVRIQEIEEFSVYLFIPSKDISGIVAHDIVQDVIPFIYSALVGFSPSSGLAENRASSIAVTGNGFQEYNGSVYIHYIDFQSVRFITGADTYTNDTSVAMRDVQITTTNSFDEPLTVALIDLDEEPLP
jgi:hypothetical protein